MKEIQARIPCLMGPTACGKTKLAIDLCQQLPLEIISVDSAMVYRGMDIGSATPTKEELQQAPHRLINFKDPLEAYSAANFRQDAIREIENILQQDKTPLLVGGTMLYFKALQQGLSDLPEANPEIRAQIELEAQQQGWHAVHQQLKKVDPLAAKRIHPNDPQRLQRALEVYRITGKSLTELQQAGEKEKLPYEFINIGLMPSDRELLRKKIAERFQTMLSEGFVDEVKVLYARGDLHENLPAIRAVGYRQVWDYLAGKCDLATMQEKAVIATCQLAKRQMTWLRHWPEVHLFDAQDPQLLAKALKLFAKL